MRSLTLLSLIVGLAVCYLLYSRSTQSGQTPAAAQVQNGEHAASNDVYKADMDQAHAAARLMAKDREESEAH